MDRWQRTRPPPKDSLLRPDKQQPFHGYFYRILTKQGAAAKGGAKDYVVNGKMTGGFAFVAYPEKYGDTGIMTLIVDQSGVVYEKNLGKDTARTGESDDRIQSRQDLESHRRIGADQVRASERKHSIRCR